MRADRILAAGCAAAVLALGTGAQPAAGASAGSAPVIHESFTPLPCPRRPATTLQLEGCAEQRVIATDGTIDRLNARIFARLSAAGRRAFVQANRNWLRYRNAACTAEASIYGGGSLQPLVYANCLVSIDRSHVSELKRMRLALSPAG